MTIYASGIKRKLQATQGAATKQQSVDEMDMMAIQKICDALANIDTCAAREIISQPHIISGLMSNAVKSKHHIKCPYALHALLVPLCTSDYKDILNRMSDDRIGMLKNLITMAKKLERPNKELIASWLQKRTNVQTTEQNKGMLLALRILEKVEDVWDDAIQELDNWSGAIESFNRTSSAQEEQTAVIPAQETNESWTINELVANLGGVTKSVFYTRKNRILNKYPERANEINSWFKTVGKTKVFDAKHFEEYKKMHDEKQPRGRKPGTKVIKKNAKTVLQQPQTLSEIKAFEAYMAKLSEMYTNAKGDLTRAEAECAEATEKATHATNARERADYLNRATSANEIVLKNQENVNDLSKKLAETKKLWKAREQAFEALCVADKQIAEFLAQNKMISL